MSDQNNQGASLKLNLQAKAYQPKFAQSSNPQPQPQPQVYNPYMGYDMSNPYGGMQYGNMYQNPNMMMQQPMQPMMQPGYQPQPLPNQKKLEDENEEVNIPGLGPQKKKKKKKVENESQPMPQPQYQMNNNSMPQMSLQQPKQPQQALKQPQQPVQKTQPPQGQPQAKKAQPKTEAVPQSTIKEAPKKAETKPVEKIEKDLEKMDLVEDTFEGTMIEVDATKLPVSLVFVGHVDAGKSTISGSILYKLGQIDERTIEKYQREAKRHNRESWFIAYIMDVNEEERERGKTVEIGKAFFETPSKRFTLLDAPGHAGYIPNLLQGACQADFAGLVISAKQGEFEAGFEKTGSTREHTLLLRALGVNTIIVIVNKMDDDTVKWSEDRYNHIKKELQPFLKSCGYNLDKNVFWLPMSGLSFDGLIQKVDPHKCPWYKGPTLMETLDALEVPKRDEKGAVRVSILDRYKENSVFIMGKLENGIVKYGDTLTLMPSKIKIDVGWLFDSEERGVPYAKPGETIRIRCKGLENENDIYRGNILCSNDDLCAVFNTFEAEIQVLELQGEQIITNGFKCILHYHTFIEECSLDLKCEIDRTSKEEKKVKFVRSQTRIKAFVKTANTLCGEKFEKLPALGRFAMRYEGLTIAIGKVLKYKPLK